MNAPLPVLKSEPAMTPADVGVGESQICIGMPADYCAGADYFDVHLFGRNAKLQGHKSDGQIQVRPLPIVVGVANDHSCLAHGNFPRGRTGEIESSASITGTEDFARGLFRRWCVVTLRFGPIGITFRYLPLATHQSPPTTHHSPIS